MSEEGGDEIKGYLVGYGRPPAEHQFKKGQSGNPSGRPKGSRKKREPLRGSDRPTQMMILEEAYRPISLRDGENVIELPAIQAVLRAMGISALKGNRLAQKMLTDIVQKVEQEHRDIQYANIEQFTTYKEKWDAEIKRCERLGLPDPEPLPHPDDVIIDYRLGRCDIIGPMTKEEKARLDRLLARRDESQEEVLHYQTMIKEEPGRAEAYREQLLWEQELFDLISEQIPPRLRTKLEGRVAGNGAKIKLRKAA
jgi:hypothetical protein